MIQGPGPGVGPAKGTEAEVGPAAVSGGLLCAGCNDCCEAAGCEAAGCDETGGKAGGGAEGGAEGGAAAGGGAAAAGGAWACWTARCRSESEKGESCARRSSWCT